MKLYAISDLHLSYVENRRALAALPPHPDDWLLVAGDVSETEKWFRAAMALLSQRFARVFWTPGNHDLWTMPQNEDGLRGLFKYNQLVSICRQYGVLTPEDPYVTWPGEGPDYFIAPTFTLYDYTFRPDHIPAEAAVAWAAESNVICADEYLLHPDPFPSREAWCEARCRYTEKRLEEIASQGPMILFNHYPLRQDLVRLWRIPRFSIWCGTCLTAEWHTRFPVTAVIHGHLHIRATLVRDGVPFTEASLGYPRQWNQEKGLEPYLREILPGE